MIKNTIASLLLGLLMLVNTNKAFAQAAVVPLGDQLIVILTKETSGNGGPNISLNFSSFDYQRMN